MLKVSIKGLSNEEIMGNKAIRSIKWNQIILSEIVDIGKDGNGRKTLGWNIWFRVYSNQKLESTYRT